MPERNHSPQAKIQTTFLHDTPNRTRLLSATFDNLRALLAPARMRFTSSADSFFAGGTLLPAAAPPRRAGELSLLLHSVALAALLLPAVSTVVNPQPPGITIQWDKPISFPNWKPPLVARGIGQPQGGGGGGDRSPEPATRGGLARFTRLQLAPPSFIKNPNPKLGVEATLVGPPEIRVPETDRVGDPLAPFLNDSQGRGRGGGIGDGDGRGIGKHKGDGFGHNGETGYGGVPGPPGRNGVGYPECIYCPNPAFTEEARKAKHQGSVLLRLIVLPDGRAAGVTVVRGLGMGLDESAASAVRDWKFRPALGPNRKPAAVEVFIEVTFRLL